LGVLISFMRRGVSAGAVGAGVRAVLGLVLGVGLEVRDDGSRGLGEMAGVDMVMLHPGDDTEGADTAAPG
jgi:hypothetical protein